MVVKFKSDYTFETRLQETIRIKNKYPDKLPIICESSDNSHGVPEIDKKKYLVPCDITIGQFISIIRQRIKLAPDKAIFIFINNVLPPTSATIYSIYNEMKHGDGFLYIYYNGESVFG